MKCMASKAYHLRLLAIFCLIALVSYFTVINSFFLSDDFDQIGKVLQGDMSVTWGRGEGVGFFRPLFILSYIIDSKLWGANSYGYHLTNLALHALNSYLVSIFSLRLMKRMRSETALANSVSISAGLLFLLNPSHTEAVSWISGRADLIATLFFLSALIYYDSYRSKARAWLLALTLLFFILSLLAKESSLCFPFIIAAIELSSREGKRDELKRLMKVAGLLILSLLIYFLIRRAAIGTFVGVYGAGQHLNFKLSLVWERVPKYLLRALLPPLPLELSSVLIKPMKSRAFLIFAAIFLSAAAALLVFRHRRIRAEERKRQNRILLLLLGCFLLSLLPVITLGISLFDTSGERFVYLPSIFTSPALGYFFAALISSKRVWLVIIAGLLIFYSASLYRSNRRWQDAAHLSQSILNDLVEESKSDDLLILNIPDNLRGVPVYRNGIEQALATFQRVKKIGRVQVVAYHSIQTSGGNVEVTRDDENVSIRLLDERAEFARINDRVDCVKILNQSRNSLMLDLQNCFINREIFFFQDGRVMKASQ